MKNNQSTKGTKVAIYSRVSTTHKVQEHETQLKPLRDFCAANGWDIYREYTDNASAVNIAHRTAWQELLADAAECKFEAVLVYKLDRAFRSMEDMHDTLAAWESVGITFKSLREQIDTSTASGHVFIGILAAIFEYWLMENRERIKAGMERAARQGKKIGRPKVTDRQGFATRYKTILERLDSGELSRRKAAKELGIGYATFKRLLDSNFALT